MAGTLRPALVAQFARFLGVGAFATVVHLIIAAAVDLVLEWSPLQANAVGYAGAFTVSYLGHFYWTFGQQEGHRIRLPRFLIVSAFGFALTNVVVVAVVNIAGAPFRLALVGILVIVPPTTWLMNRYWTFDETPDRHEHRRTLT